MKNNIQFISACFLILMAISCQQSEVLSPATSNTTNTVNTTPTVSNDDPSITNADLATSHSDLSTTNGLSAVSDGTCQPRLQGTWALSEVFDHEGNSTTCDMIYAHLPDILEFTYYEVRLDWVDPTGFHRLGYTLNTTPDGCYDAMYKANCTDRLLDICDLYCSDPSPLAARCGPPQYGRFKIISISSTTLILDSYEGGWSAEDYFPIPADYVQRFVLERF